LENCLQSVSNSQSFTLILLTYSEKKKMTHKFNGYTLYYQKLWVKNSASLFQRTLYLLSIIRFMDKKEF